MFVNLKVGNYYLCLRKVIESTDVTQIEIFKELSDAQ
jgi:hypothetical protein